MKIKFHKYQGTGNDFIMLDNLNGEYDNLSILQIRQLCDRRFGIGADGLIKLNQVPGNAFEVDYYNSDGSKSFCGNGARCSLMFAKHLGIDVSSVDFSAIDGQHNAIVDSADLVYLQMSTITDISKRDSDYILNTGSPHYVHFVGELNSVNCVEYGKSIRYSEEFKQDGINVNVVEVLSNTEIAIASYERGVEDETLSCGTGATACAIAFAEDRKMLGSQLITVKVKGGELKVAFDISEKRVYSNVRLIGPGTFVFKGKINV